MLALLGAAPAPEAKWQPIFDGKTLAGWTPKITGRAVGEDPRGMFTVQNGAIRVSHASYEKFEGEFGHLFWKAPLKAYQEVARMLLPPEARPRGSVSPATGILRIDLNEDPQLPFRTKLDRNGMRRRLLQLSAIQPSLDKADARRAVLARARRKMASTGPVLATTDGDEVGDD